MNANKLFKLLENGKDSFSRLPQYKQILEQSARVVVDFSEFKSFEIFTTRAATIARENGLSSPFDNLLLDLQKVMAPSISSNSILQQDIMLHLIPVELATDISTFSMMLVQDMRVVNKDVYPRSHLVSLNKDELASMPAVDEGMPDLGCRCSIKNPFSHQPIFKQIQSFTPGFKADCGFAAFNCQSKLACCKQILDGSAAITQIAMATMIYLSMPGHCALKVTNTGHRKQEGIKQMTYYIVADKDVIDDLKNGKKPRPLAFNDGNDFDKFNAVDKLVVEPFVANNISYEPVLK